MNITKILDIKWPFVVILSIYCPGKKSFIIRFNFVRYSFLVHGPGSSSRFDSGQNCGLFSSSKLKLKWITIFSFVSKFQKYVKDVWKIIHLRLIVSKIPPYISVWILSFLAHPKHHFFFRLKMDIVRVVPQKGLPFPQN